MPFSDPILGGGGTLIREAIHSPNYVPGVSGWSINKDGTAEFNDAVIRGSLEAGEIHIGGFDSTSFHVDSAGNMWSGAASAATAPLTISNTGVVTITDQITGMNTRLEQGQIVYANSSHDLVAIDVTGNALRIVTTQSFPPVPGGDNQIGITGESIGMHDYNTDDRLWINNYAVTEFRSTSGKFLFESMSGVGRQLYIGEWSGGNTYAGLFLDQAGSSFMIMGNAQHTYVSNLGGSVFIRPGGNTTAQQTEFNAAGRTIFNGAAGLRVVAGNAATVPLAVRNNNMGLFSAASNSLDVAVNGVHQFSWTQSGGMYAPGMRLSSAGGAIVRRFPSSGNELFAESSSLEHKRNIRALPAEYGHKLLKVDLISWDAMAVDLDGSTVELGADHRPEDRGQLWERPGMAAQQVAEIFPEAALYDAQGEVIGIDDKVIDMALISIVRSVVERLERLEGYR